MVYAATFTNTEFHYRNLKNPLRHEVCNLYDAKHLWFNIQWYIYEPCLYKIWQIYLP